MASKFLRWLLDFLKLCGTLENGKGKQGEENYSENKKRD
jgi:hypothetical protein